MFAFQIPIKRKTYINNRYMTLSVWKRLWKSSTKLSKWTSVNSRIQEQITFSDCSAKNKLSKLRISEDLHAMKTDWLPKNSTSVSKNVILMLRCFIEIMHLRSLSFHPLHIRQTSVPFFHKLAQPSLFLNPCGQYWHDWWGNPSSSRDTNHVPTQSPIESKLIPFHTVRLNALKTPPSHRSGV